MTFVQMSGESKLVASAQQGNAEAFSELYRRHVDQIYRYMLARVGDPSTAEDLTSEVFMRALESLGNYEDRGVPFVAWLYRIANARVVDFWRRAKHDEVSIDEMAQEYAVEMPGGDVVTYRALSRAMKHLTSEQQQVIVLRFIEGFSAAEVSQLMGRSEGAIKALQHRALASLARLMDS
jgi:RNA polymerase sigma-70 factor (ECF subfamily)